MSGHRLDRAVILRAFTDNVIPPDVDHSTICVAEGVAHRDAGLIAAAPDLLDACQRCIEILETVEAKALVGDEGCLWPVEIMRTAIAKATQRPDTRGEARDDHD